MHYVSAIATVVIPFATLLVPGVFLVRLVRTGDTLMNGSRTILWSLGVLILATFAAAMAGISGTIAVLAVVLVSLYAAWRLRVIDVSLPYVWYLLAILVPLIVAYGAFGIPYAMIHDGLPTGDSQKSIIWAEEINNTNRLPEYSRSIENLNRDPVDFLTPGLHAFTAAVMNLSPLPLISVGFQSIAFGVATAWVAASIARELFYRRSQILLPALAALFVLTNVRFLRYLREPGYHYQNLIGELLLFGLMLMLLSLIRSWRWDDAGLAIVVAAALVVSHQFSVFVGIFALVPLVIGLVISRMGTLTLFARTHTAAIATALVALLGVIAAGFSAGLQNKVSRFFTSTPHLLSLTPNIADYPLVMGTVWFLAGLAGLILLCMTVRREKYGIHVMAFVGAAVALLLLSQGPRLFIDIPPVRALFYTVIPLSVTAAFFFASLMEHVRRKRAGVAGTAFISFIIIVIGASVFVPASKAFSTMSHEIRTNSTLLPSQQILIDYIAKTARGASEGVLVDDYNRRSTSWLALSGQPMFTRIAADLERQMDESEQSEIRKRLYLNQLDFEKIYALGSRPELASLLTKHNIRWITGIERSSNTSFQRNPVLREAARASDVVLYEIAEYPKDSSRTEMVTGQGGIDIWLLRASTLVNDIGDREDTFKHLPASIRAPRLSGPRVKDGITYRTTTATYIPLQFNVGDYVQALWDQERTGRPDASIELFVDFLERPAGIELITPDGSRHVLDGTAPLVVPPSQVPFDKKGFIELMLYNPEQKPVSIDLIALGLARTP